MDQTFVSLDLEMTGLGRDGERIIEIGAIKFRDGRTIDTLATLVNPQCRLPFKIVDLTGISQQDVDRAPLLTEVASQLVRFVGKHPIVGHTISQDLDCLARNGIVLDNPQVDTFELASILLPSLPSYGLAALAQHLGIKFREKHRAADDALMAKELFDLLYKRALNLDLTQVQSINQLAANVPWPHKDFFLAVERELSRNVFVGGASIRQHLLAKVGPSEASLESMLLGRDEPEPLEPSPSLKPVDVDAVVAEWAPGGAVARKFRAYEHRPQQLELLRAVADTFNTGGQLVAEAGTGTGKGLAYLIPALHFAAQNSERVVVSTNTIALQDQLFDKDIPDLRRMLPVDFKAALLKGRTNYLCLWRYRTERERPDLTLDELTTLVKVLVWMPTTATGDWAELNLTPPEKAIWPRLTTTQETCLGHQCSFYQNNTCFLYRARKEANGAHVVVVNHALLLADLVAESNVLPDYRYLVVDEAHRLEEEATEQLGYRVSRRQIEQLLDQPARSSGGRGNLGDLRNRLRPRTAASARGDLDGEARKLEQHVDASRQAIASFFAGIAQFLSAHSSGEGDYGRRLRLRPAERAQPDWTQRVEIEWERASLRLADVMASLERLHVFFTGLGESKVASLDQLLLQLLAVHKQLQMARNCLEAAISQPDPNMVYWITAIGGHGEPDLAIHAAPLSVSELLRRQLFDLKRATVLTSATISVDGSFDYLGGRLGLGGARELRVDSPFDYQKAALVYVPADVPEPNRPGHQRAVEVALVNLCRATQGRALVLFTSRSQLHATYEAIRRPLEQAGVVVLGQGVDRASRRQLLHSFRDSGRAVLLGLASFWEGVDVVGDALSVLVIVKLPFPVPNEPVFAARSEAFANAFNEYSVPQTVLKFKQGFGRLIRSHQDRGLLVVLDTRILTKAYGKVFLGSLPPTEIQRGTVRDLPTVAAGWLNANARQPRVSSPARPRQ